MIENGKAYTHSDAALNIAVHLDGKWSAPYFLIVVPKFIRDFFYKLFAKYRYKMFGKKDVCMMPTPANKAEIFRLKGRNPTVLEGAKQRIINYESNLERKSFSRIG